MMKKLMERVRMIRENQKENGKKGFSMIELIIVIAIMAILVALIGTQLIPYLEKSREGRDKTTLDTIITATQTVVADHEIALAKGDSTVSTIIGSYTAEFEKYAGLSSTDTPFKSAAAGKSATYGSVKINVGDNGVITGAEVGSLKVEAKSKAGTGGTSGTSGSGGTDGI